MARASCLGLRPSRPPRSALRACTARRAAAEIVAAGGTGRCSAAATLTTLDEPPPGTWGQQRQDDAPSWRKPAGPRLRLVAPSEPPAPKQPRLVAAQIGLGV